MSTQKKNKGAAKAAETTHATASETAPVTITAPVALVKKTKAVKIELPKTEAQIAAQKILDEANAAAQAQLVRDSAGKIDDATQKVVEAKNAVKVAAAELKALKKAVGIKGVFGGGKKITTLTYATDYPEGKGAPQARAILEIIKAGGAAGVTREVVVKTMETAIQTNMDRSRLLSYYCSKMIADGVITGA